MYSSSEISGYVNPDKIQSQTIIKTLFAHLNLYSTAPELETLCYRSREVLSSGASGTTEVGVNGEREKSEGFHRASQICLEQMLAHKEKEKGTAFFERRPRLVDERPSDDAPLSSECRRWALLNQALIQYPILLKGRVGLAHTVDGSQCRHLNPEQLVAENVQNWPSSDLLRSVDGLIVGMILWLANLCYGGIHAAAWNDHYPTVAEKWLWRASVSYIGFCGGFWVLLNFAVAKCRRLNDFWESWADGKKTWWQNVGLGIVVFICGFSLVFARFFILLEAFISVRKMPASAYQTPEWTAIFPHF